MIWMKTKTINHKDGKATTNQYVDTIKAHSFFIKHKYIIKKLQFVDIFFLA